ncbi:hypothetical protein ABBQ32_010679 [Trebouxia sp. C0010 RCD-2024]
MLPIVRRPGRFLNSQTSSSSHRVQLSFQLACAASAQNRSAGEKGRARLRRSPFQSGYPVRQNMRSSDLARGVSELVAPSQDYSYQGAEAATCEQECAAEAMLDDTWLDGLAFMGLPGATDVEMADGTMGAVEARMPADGRTSSEVLAAKYDKLAAGLLECCDNIF